MTDGVAERAPSGRPTPAIVRLPTYAVTIAPGSLDAVGMMAQQCAPAHRYAVITDERLAPLFADRVMASFGAARPDVYTIPAGEAYKTRDSWAALTDRMLADGFGRDAAIVALGGGVIGDLAGFVAATYMRGIPFIQVPTTLLAMIDASIGGKTGVDTAAGKNLVGAFHQPAAVIVDPETLGTLPLEQLRAGLAEALKHGVIADAGYLERTVADLPALLGAQRGDQALAARTALITRSVEIKADVVTRDEREGGVRKTLNFGHTLGHAIEHGSAYTLLHGEAVAIGMALESRVAERLGVAEAGTAERITEAIRCAGLPWHRPADQPPAAILAGTRGDKKTRAGVVEYALPASVGRMAGADSGWAVPVDDALVLEVLNA